MQVSLSPITCKLSVVNCLWYKYWWDSTRLLKPATSIAKWKSNGNSENKILLCITEAVQII